MFMRKLFTLSAVLMSAAILCAAPVKIDRSSKEKIVETLLVSICDNNRDALWMLMAADNQQRMNAATASETRSKELLWNLFSAVIPPEKFSEIKEILKVPEAKKELIAGLSISLTPALVEKNGEWFFDFARLAQNKDESMAVPDIKWQVDQSSKEKLLFTFFMAVADRNIDAIWQIIPQEIKISGIAECGSEKKAKEALVKNIFESSSEMEARNTKRILGNPATAEPFIRALLPKLDKGMVKIDGKWFLDISKFAQ